MGLGLIPVYVRHCTTELRSCRDDEHIFLSQKPFEIAVLQGRLEIAEFLKGFTTDLSCAHIDITPSELREVLGPRAVTLLGYCLWQLDAGTIKTRIVRYVLQTEPDFVVCPDHGMTALHAAVVSPWERQKRNCKCSVPIKFQR